MRIFPASLLLEGRRSFVRGCKRKRMIKPPICTPRPALYCTPCYAPVGLGAHTPPHRLALHYLLCLRRGDPRGRPPARAFLLSVGAGFYPARPALPRTPCQKTCHCEASARTGCGNPPPPLLPKKHTAACRKVFSTRCRTDFYVLYLPLRLLSFPR